MGRVLFYPLVALFVAGTISATVALIVVTIARARANDARRRARWEISTEIRNDDLAIIGVRLVARWGNHREILKTSPDTEQIPAENLIEILEAQGRARARADAYNNIEKRNPNQR